MSATLPGKAREALGEAGMITFPQYSLVYGGAWRAKREWNLMSLSRPFLYLSLSRPPASYDPKRETVDDCPRPGLGRSVEHPPGRVQVTSLSEAVQVLIYIYIYINIYIYLHI